MINIGADKILCLILIWFVAYQSAVFASFDELLESGTVVHCENEQTASHDCCHDIITTTHCNSCFLTTLALMSNSSMVFVNDNHRLIDGYRLHHHPEPLLELFKPPI